MSERIDRPFKGHLIVADECHWFRTTDVGDVRISSIGDYRPRIGGVRRPHEIGLGRTFETMVFRLGATVHQCDNAACPMNGAREVDEWSEVDVDGYNSAAAANRGHEAMVAKYLNAQEAP